MKWHAAAAATNDLTLTMDRGLGVQTAIVGELTEGRLTLFWPAADGSMSPMTLNHGTVGEYNQAVEALTRAGQQIQTEQAHQAAATAVRDAELTKASGRVISSAADLEQALGALEGA